MTTKTPGRNQSPAPVTGRFARLFRRPTTTTATPAVLAHDPVPDLVRDLHDAQDEAARWKRHADSYAQDRERAVAALATAYRDRDAVHSQMAHLLAWLCALHPASAVITPARDTDDEDGPRVLYLMAGGWQMSWPIPPADVHLFRHVTAVDRSDPRAQWDGHGTAQTYARIRQHVRRLALDAPAADAPSTAATTEARSA